ncbi:MAG: PDZ domain-containing protein [Proteobacteria bacterium]|nr:MAG: PDZ domain-containing protein [Pseudomonadota bacterium]
MEFLAHPIVAVVLLLGILVFVHESGHFLVGKLCGIPVEIFSIGFGPVIFGFQHKETHYRISIIPLGGFVKFYGGVPSEEVPSFIQGREFWRAPIAARLATIFAGPTANIILAIFVFAAMVMHGIKQAPAFIGELIPGSPAERGGLLFGDKVVQINEAKIASWKDLQRIISDAPAKTLNIKVERQGQLVDKSVSTDSVDEKELPGKKGRIGISPYIVPTVFTVVNKTGALAIAGVKTGERAVRATFNGKDYDVLFWRNWTAFLQTVAETPGAKNFVVSVQNFDPAKDEGRVSQSPQRNLAVELPESFAYSAEGLSEATGVSSSQLTIFKTGPEVGDAVRPGDMILAWNGKPVKNLFEFGEIASENRQENVPIEILRDGQKQTVDLKLKAIEVQKLEGKVTIYTLAAEYWGGFVQPDPVEEKFTNPFLALQYGAHETWDMVKNIGGALVGLFTGAMPLTTLGGPIAIAKAASDSVRIGWQAYLSALAIISINLALINMVPIPILDGGQIVLIASEAVVRRPVRERTIENYQKVGFIMVLALIVIATYNDVGRFWASMMRGVGGMF